MRNAAAGAVDATFAFLFARWDRWKASVGTNFIQNDALTSLQRPFGDFVAVGAPARSVIGGHLDLIVGPDDEVFQEQAGLVRVRDIFHLTVNREP